MTDLTPPEHEHSAAVDEAARWYATMSQDKPKAPIPVLRDRFGLTAQEACYALREAALINGGAR
jgi:hypothetical protein